MALPVTGIGQAAFVKAETTFDTGVAAAAADAVSPIELKITPEQEWLKSEEHSGSASLQTEVEGLRGGSWDGTFYIKPINSSTQPDIGPILVAAGMTYGSSAYTLNSSDASSIQITKGEGLYGEWTNGSWVEEIDINVEGNGIPTLNAKGRFASHGHCLGTIVTASGSGTSVVLDSGDAWKVTPGARIQIASDDNSGAGFLVTALASDGVTLTVGSSVGTLSGGEAVIPFIPSTTTAGTVLGAIACSLSVGGTAVGFIDFKLNYKTGISGLDQEASADRANRVVRGMREVTGSMKFYLLDENAGFIGKAWEGTTQSISCRVGANTSGARLTIACPAARLSVAEIETPGTEAAVYEASFTARQSSTANDELTLTFD